MSGADEAIQGVGKRVMDGGGVSDWCHNIC